MLGASHFPPQRGRLCVAERLERQLPALADAALPGKRGPKTSEGKARSAINALKHGLRAREFGLLPEEDQREWAEHVRDLRAGLDPVDAAEEKLVTALAVAMWNEIRADRTLVETMAKIPPRRPGRSHGTDLHDPGHSCSLGIAIRYMIAAGMATQRAQRAFLAHRKAKQTGLILPPNEIQTNKLPVGACNNGPRSAPEEPKDMNAGPAAPATGANCTNELPGAGRPSHRTIPKPRSPARGPCPAAP